MQKMKLWLLAFLVASTTACVIKLPKEVPPEVRVTCVQDGKEVPCPTLPETETTCVVAAGTNTCPAPTPTEKPTLTMSKVSTLNGLVFAEEKNVRFTVLTLTANGGDIPVRGITVERIGASYDSSFTGVSLSVNEMPVDHVQQLNSYHQASFSDTFVVKEGTSSTLVVTADMANDLSGAGGTVAAFAVIAIDTSATIVGEFPIIGAYMTLNNTLNIGAVSVSYSPLSPPYTIVASGSSDVDMGSHRLCPRSGSFDLDRIGLKLVSGSGLDLQEVSLWEGSTEVGRAVFVGTRDRAVSTLMSRIRLEQNKPCKDLTIRATLMNTGLAESGTEGGFIQIEIDPETTRGINLTYGVVVGVATSGNHTNGVRMFKSIPSFALEALPTTGVADGNLMQFSVKADVHGAISLGQIVTTIQCDGAGITNLALFAYTDPYYTVPVSGFVSGQLVPTTQFSGPTNGIWAVLRIQGGIPIPAGMKYYFRLVGAVVPTATLYSCTSALLGDTRYSSQTGESNDVDLGTVDEIAQSGSNLIWSPDTLGLSKPTDRNWMNGVVVPGLPGDGLIQTRPN